MKRCLNCRKTYDEDLPECPHCGYKPRSKSVAQADKDNRNISSHSGKSMPQPTYSPTKRVNRKNISSNSRGNHAGSFYLQGGERLNNNRYSVVNVIGFGSFGVAYECFDNNTQRRVVVKEYMPSFLVSRSPNGRDVQPLSQETEIKFSIGIDAFVDESKKLSDNEIRCMPRMIEYFYQNKTSYVVTELIQGETLSSIIKRKGRLSYQSSVSVITGVLQGLRQLNKIGVIHSDICPENIVVTSNGSAKLLDYNLSDFNKTIYTQRDSGKLRVGYSAFEMYYKGMPQGPWTDVYAAAATMYKMLTGITVASAIKRNSSECLVAPSKLGVSITPGAEKAMLKALTVDYKNRTQNPEDFLNGLTGDGYSNLTADDSNDDLPKIKPQKKHRDGNVVLNTILIFLVIAIIGVAIWLFVSGVFQLPSFITDKLGLGGGSNIDTDTSAEYDSDTSTTEFVGDFYSDTDTETDTGNLIDDILSGINSYISDETSSEEDYSSEYYDDTSSYDDYPSNDGTVSEDYSSYDDISSYDEYSDTSSENIIDDITSGLSSAMDDVVSGAGEYLNSLWSSNAW